MSKVLQELAKMTAQFDRLCAILFSLSLLTACSKTEESSDILQKSFIGDASELKTCVSYLGIEQFLADKNACASELTKGPAGAGAQVAYAGHVTVNGTKNYKFLYIGRYDSDANGTQYSCILNADQITKLKQQNPNYSVLKANNRRFFENTVRCGNETATGKRDSGDQGPAQEVSVRGGVVFVTRDAAIPMQEAEVRLCRPDGDWCTSHYYTASDGMYYFKVVPGIYAVVINNKVRKQVNVPSKPSFDVDPLVGNR